MLTAPEALHAILDRAGESRFARVRPAVAPRVWREAVGARIADRTAPISLSGGLLVLRVATSVWAHELSLLSETICARLRERDIQVRELRFFVGEVAVVERTPERRAARVVPPTSALPFSLAQALAGVPDPGLRDLIAGAAASNLAWQSSLAPPTTAESVVTEARRGARAPRSAESKNAPRAQSSPVSDAESPRSRGDGRDRSR